jgi:hypothetical protein
MSLLNDLANRQIATPAPAAALAEHVGVLTPRNLAMRRSRSGGISNFPAGVERDPGPLPGVAQGNFVELLAVPLGPDEYLQNHLQLAL